VSTVPQPGQHGDGHAPGPYEILSSGKELSRIHKSWLGPQGFTLPWPIPYVGAAGFGVALLFAVPLLGVFGLAGLWHYGGAVALAVAVGWAVSRISSSDRPMGAFLAALWHEMSAPRPPRDRPESGRRPRRPLTASRGLTLARRPASSPQRHKGRSRVP
jgi:hypothetical protein